MISWKCSSKPTLNHCNAVMKGTNIMKKSVLQESDKGVIFRFDKIPNTMFNFYILKTREFKDHTHSYKICVELASNPAKYWVLDTIRGRKSDAVKRLEEIIRNS